MTILILSGLASLLTTPLLRRMAIALDITDKPSNRKVHDQPIPYLGGLAFHFSMTAALLYVFWKAPYILDAQISSQQLLALYGVAMGFQLLGVVDDARPVSPKIKLLIQTILAVILVRSGFVIEQVSNPFGGAIPFGWIGGLASVLWILTIVNAINFIDGLDGLAAGIVFFAALANFLIALYPWQNFVCLISLVLMGATIGFLPYNFSPAKIFMGDAGSLYLGVLLAGSSLVSNTKGATVMSLSLPLVILSIPLLDALLTVVRRGKRGMNLFTADRGHVHHRLLRLGFNVRQSVLSIYGLCFLLAMTAVLADQLPDPFKMVFIFVFFAAVWWGFLIFSAIESRVIGKNDSTLNAESAKQPDSE
ncbi:MAG: undecaprenyl/decaprenyl-phosphate alpha-N-acetylglucosaminyl 1-phosphate transferase [Candidatus Omnitrophica bacterium]|nr:undecaprenyl/decaprenyl-phosphate alpha-N-acetylglucosaminyl 1-phosphate transferase [Candidatus Omnitrophota bacterium]